MTANLTLISPADLVDLERYPIHDLASPAGTALVNGLRSKLQEAGACQLPGFLKPSVIELLVADAERLAAHAYPKEDVHNVHFEDVDESLPTDHPLHLMQHSARESIAGDLIPAASPLRRLYEWDALTDFVAAALGKSVLYRLADPLGDLNIAMYDADDELGWHFDRADFVVTLEFQTAEKGGDFEYVPMIRTPENENHPALQRLLHGSREGVIALPSEPGTLAFFRGKYSIHRVTPVQGGRQRLNAVLSYADQPGRTMSAYAQQRFYGRSV